MEITRSSWKNIRKQECISSKLCIAEYSLVLIVILSNSPMAGDELPSTVVYIQTDMLSGQSPKKQVSDSFDFLFIVNLF
jgi:hypothetical protein